MPYLIFMCQKYKNATENVWYGMCKNSRNDNYHRKIIIQKMCPKMCTVQRFADKPEAQFEL